MKGAPLATTIGGGCDCETLSLAQRRRQQQLRDGGNIDKIEEGLFRRSQFRIAMHRMANIDAMRGLAGAQEFFEIMR
jgi:hypothetical protein